MVGPTLPHNSSLTTSEAGPILSGQLHCPRCIYFSKPLSLHDSNYLDLARSGQCPRSWSYIGGLLSSYACIPIVHFVASLLLPLAQLRSAYVLPPPRLGGICLCI